MASDINGKSQTQTEEPIRSELFSLERLEQFGESLAKEHVVTVGPGKPLIPRVLNNGRLLLQYYRAIVKATDQEQTATPAAEWLTDNFYVVEEQLREIRDDLPPGFYRTLPKLVSGKLQGYPRVFALAWAYVAHTDSRLEPDSLKLFVSAYQRIQPLTIGELWALAISLRIVLVENLRRIAEIIVESREARRRANQLAGTLLQPGDQAEAAVSKVLNVLEKDSLDRPFVVQLVQQLRDASPAVTPVLTWLDQRLADQGTNADEVVRTEHQSLAALNVSVRNVITSMRFASSYDWHKFFESVSLVDELFRKNSKFADMDFATRDSYRHAVENLSRYSEYSEIEVARHIVERIQFHRGEVKSGGAEFEERQTDPGYYLLSHGRVELEESLGFKADWKKRMLGLYMRAAIPGYLGSIAVLTAMILSLPLLRSYFLSMSAPLVFLMALLAMIPASDLAIALVNRTVTDVLGPRVPPRMELRDGIPEEFRTIIVIPTMLTSVETINEQAHQLEVHFLANNGGELRFALVTDWTDAASESVPTDDSLLKTAVARILDLNKRYGPASNGDPRFFLFHRKRLWNESQQKWMGWERKRGKLHELNRLLRGAKDTTFIPVECNLGPPPEDVRFVITLDADTRVPRGVATRLVGTMAHPLNRPMYFPSRRIVGDGYGIVQPRITPMLPVQNEGTLFQKIYAGARGIDPYSHTVSDVYQDLFAEGSYTGKGIYDIDAFEWALAGKIPENTVLSHDLLEGIFARTALATDVELLEEFPFHFEVAAARQHRWARGDWQLLPWILAGIWKRDGKEHLWIPPIGRWKMLDNLRRSLFAPCAFFMLLAGWLLSPSPWVWDRFVLAVVAIPALLPFLIDLYPEQTGIAKRTHFRQALSNLWIGVLQTALTLTFLAFNAWLMLDAILTTLWRLCFTRRKMLEWVTAAQAKRGVDFSTRRTYLRMAGGVLFSLASAALLFAFSPRASAASLPFLILWLAAPAAARWISLPPKIAGMRPLSAAEVGVFRLTGRRTWRFFETFVTSEDRALPPDNFQEDPKPIVAHRTSPTNIGLYLLSTLAAHDFGWQGIADTVDRLEATLDTMRHLPRFRGHFYNWYDTKDLHPLEPPYVSSVDSGNLAGHLLALRNGCQELIQKPWPLTQALAGIGDSVDLLKAALAEISDVRRTHTVTRKQLSDALDALTGELQWFLKQGFNLAERFQALKAKAHTVEDIAQTLSDELAEASGSELRVWAQSIRSDLESHFRDAAFLNPLLSLAPKDLAAVRIAWTAAAKEDPPAWEAAESLLRTMPTLQAAPGHFETLLEELGRLKASAFKNPKAADRQTVEHLELLEAAARSSAARASEVAGRISKIAETAQEMFDAMDFSFLFDESRKLLSLGYLAASGSLDTNCYDLLASEARLASFIAIAKGDAPPDHWFRLGRPLAPVGTGSALISWAGSMFEYLMPVLVMHSPEGSLLSQTYKLAVRRHMGYGEERHVPWGISESAFNLRDIDFTYQYSAFGVPGLGLKRGLAQDLVIAPYATALAAMIEPAAAAHNLVQIAKEGGSGAYGYYESLDYTPSRIPEGKNVAIVRAFLAHHQGMSLVALHNVLNQGAMVARFHRDPIVQATELLLQERTPTDVLVLRPRAEEVSAASQVRQPVPLVSRRFASPDEAVPRTHVLSNGNYSAMVTAAGSGYSRWGDTSITRWREDPVQDCWGTFIYLRDELSGHVWSAGYQPTCSEPDEYEACFLEDRVEIKRRERTIATSMEIVISSEEDAEVRRVSISNLGIRTRTFQVTSYAELALAPQTADVAHRAFSSLFVETEYVPEVGALLAARRKRSKDEPDLWAAHLIVVDGQSVGEIEYETDRARFLGRGRGVRNPVSVLDGHPLSNTAGCVLDPVISQRRTVRIPPGSTARIIFSTLAGTSREHVLDLADKYRHPAAFERTTTLAWTQAQVQLHYLGISADEAHLFQRLANMILFSDPSMRPSSAVLARTSIELSSLWKYGISGDLPVVLVRIESVDDIEFVRQLLRAHEYWQMKSLGVDLVILNERPMSYADELQNSLQSFVAGSKMRLSHDTYKRETSGGVFLLQTHLMSANDAAQLEAFARVFLLSRRGTLSDQVLRAQRAGAERKRVPETRGTKQHAEALYPPRTLEFFNGIGGFDKNGREYAVVLEENLRTPEPWVNVVANPSFGFLVSESGAGFTWSENSHENQLTPWSNDHVSDPSGEVFYLRDEATGEVWTPTALPIRDESAVYVARHGQGYSRFQHGSHGVLADLLQFVSPSDPIKISRISIKNESSHSKRLSLTAYVEWVLGSSRARSAPYIVTGIDPPTRVLFAQNMLESDFAGQVAFLDLAGRQTSHTGDRSEFIGRNGTPSKPEALYRNEPLSGRLGAGLDPCGALQTAFELRPGESAEFWCFLGEAKNRQQASELAQRYRKADGNALFRDVVHNWDQTLEGLQVKTPDEGMNILLNRWLLYQTLSCRIWARAGFYQVSGAFGFRDQLQDAMAFSVAKPLLAREHILRAAARQFVEGDVQHWWHPPSGRGVRTRISDDLLWLPYTVFHFLEATRDMSLLDESLPFLEGEPLGEGQNESYFLPRESETRATLYEHCARAIEKSLRVGSHGLPLMGTGDWNDGMNRVGAEGKGESIWLGWFLHSILWEFAKIADMRGDRKRAETWRLHVFAVKAALEREGWDGKWYRRAYFDDGTPLGTDSASECKIDSIAQSWGVITGGAEPSRAARAMAAVAGELVRPEGLILLLAPPFDRSPNDPGYIQGYPPGIRENGGQYTHAGVWSVLAFAALGDGDKAAELFRMLNPIHRSSSRSAMQRYKVEPYAVASDVYAEPPHVGRGGWTWYTGSSGWLYRAGMEWILGLRIRGPVLSIDPCIPHDWRSYSAAYRHRDTIYKITVENPRGVSRGISTAALDGKPVAVTGSAASFALTDDKIEHSVRIVLG